MQLQQRQFLSQQSKQKRNKIKIGIFTVMFWFPKIIPWNWKHLTNHKVKGKKVFWQVILNSSCATLCVSFSLKSKAINVFPKHILKLQACDQSNQARKKLVCHMIVRNYLSILVFKVKESQLSLKMDWRTTSETSLK